MIGYIFSNTVNSERKIRQNFGRFLCIGDEYKDYAVFQTNGAVKVRSNILSGNNHTPHWPKCATLFLAWQCNLMTGIRGPGN
jgi:hypothetical protein